MASRRRVTSTAAPGLACCLSVLVLVLAGCGFVKDLFSSATKDPAGPRLSATCGVVVDGSGSSDSRGGFDADALVQKALPMFLTREKCRYVDFGPIDGTSLSSVCAAGRVDIDPDAQGEVDRRQLRAERRRTAVDRAKTVLDCIRNDPRSIKGSDVLGGLTRITRQGPADGSPFSVLVISDFVNNNNGVNLQLADLSTPASRDAVITALRDIIPDLKGVHVYTAGFGALFSNDPLQYPRFNAFWDTLLHDHSHVAELSINPFTVSVTSQSSSLSPSVSG